MEEENKQLKIKLLHLQDTKKDNDKFINIICKVLYENLDEELKGDDHYVPQEGKYEHCGILWDSHRKLIDVYNDFKNDRFGPGLYGAEKFDALEELLEFYVYQFKQLQLFRKSEKDVWDLIGENPLTTYHNNLRDAVKEHIKNKI
tara:strand:+ start:79 stop:513 length:435 start_codon:yes stop_codon:yes gene_type:complete